MDREEITNGIARRAYLWHKLIIEGQDTIEAFDKLAKEEQKAYYVLAHQLNNYWEPLIKGE